MALRAVDQQLVTRELVAAGFGLRLTLRDIDKTGQSVLDANSRSDDDGIVVA